MPHAAHLATQFLSDWGNVVDGMGRLLSMAVLAGTVAGCHDPVTEVVVVMQSDLAIPADAESVNVSFNPGPLPPMIGGFET